jgi:hypothetical protein
MAKASAEEEERLKSLTPKEREEFRRSKGKPSGVFPFSC